MQCARCGRVTNLQETRCPNCLASLSNDRISDREIVQHQLKELAEFERLNLWNSKVRKSFKLGFLIGGPLLVLTLSPWMVLIGGLVGCMVAWLVTWRRLNQIVCAIIFAAVMMPLSLLVIGFNPFVFLLFSCQGMLLGLALDSAKDM